MIRVRGVVVVVAVALLMGCDSGPSTTTVTGKITYKGKPVTSGLINFRAPGGRPLGGGIQPDGTYSAELPAGAYEVRIDAPGELPAGWKEGDPSVMGPRQVPERYAGFESSKLSATITDESSTQEVDFVIP